MEKLIYLLSLLIFTFEISAQNNSPLEEFIRINNEFERSSDSIQLTVDEAMERIDNLKSRLKNVNELFNYKLDSIEILITINKRGVDTSYYLHYTVKNISKEELTYISNSCFYYNHSQLQVSNTVFELNYEGGCSGNSFIIETISPDSSFTKSEEIEAVGLETLIIGSIKAKLTNYIVNSIEREYYVDGRDSFENKQHLIFEGQTYITSNLIDNRKKKKKSKTKKALLSIDNRAFK